MRGITLIMFILVIITLQLLFISFYLNDLRQIAEIKVCKDNPTLILDRVGPDCNCKKILNKYNITMEGVTIK